MCCNRPCLIRVYLNKAWFMQCINCRSLRPA